MKIVHWGHRMRLELGGVVRAVLDLTAALADRGHEVTLLNWDDQAARDEWADREPAPSLVGVGSPQKLLRISAEGLRIAERHIREADVLHLHAMWQPSNVQLAKIAERVGTPYILTVHGMLDDWCMAQSRAKKKVFLSLMGGTRMLERAAAVQCTASAELDQSKKYFPNGHGVVVGNLMELDEYAQLPGPQLARDAFECVNHDRPVVLFLSRVHVKKGVHHLVDAAAELKRRGVDATVVIAGTGDEAYTQQIRDQIDRLGLSDTVHLVGMVKGQTKISLYQRADVFCLPTSQENWGFVLIEALLCETPVMTTKGVDIWPELTESGGSTIHEGSGAAFADGIEALLNDPARARSMGQAGRAWVLEHLTRDAILDDFERMYTDAIGRGCR